MESKRGVATMWKSRIFWQIYLINLLIIGILLGAMFVAARVTLPEISRVSHQSITDTVAANLNEQVSNVHQYMLETEYAVQSNLHLRTNSPAELVNDIEEIAVNPLIDSITVADHQGKVLASFPNNSDYTVGDSMGQTLYFRKAVEQKWTYISDVLFSRDNQPILVLCIPLINERGEIQRVVSLTMNLDENRFLHTLFQNVDLGSGGYVYIIDGNGRILSHPDKRYIGTDGVQNEAGEVLIREKRSGNLEVIDPQGTEMYASYSYASALGWGIVAQVSVEETMTAFYVFRNTLSILAPLIFIPLSVLTFLYARQIIRPLRNLYEAVDQVAKGDYEQFIDVSDKSEIGRISNRFNEMISFIREAKDKIQYQALHDPLTGLPNRAFLRERLMRQIEEARASEQQVAVMFLDLDRFKYINDTLGHSVGDSCLKEVTARLETCLRKKDLLARVGGDEFVALLPGFKHFDEIQHIPQQILKVFEAPFLSECYELYLTTSIGIAIFPDDGEDLETLIKNADMAMYRAKEYGRNNYQLHTAAMNNAAAERMTIETNLRKALERDEFQLYYQPKVDLETRRVIGMEALIRWMHPEWGMVSPAKFIPVAEDTGLIMPIGEWVLRTACAQNKRWQNEGHPPLRVSVNLSALQFQRPHLAEQVANVLQETELEPEWLEIEITESILMDNTEAIINTMEELKGLGVHLSIDDFGTGYSSLSYLERFPIDSLKIDQSFVRPIENEESEALIAKAIISLGHSLNLEVIAEGVETVGQMEFLRTQQCDTVQGYLFSKPIPPDEFIDFLAKIRIDN